MGIKDHQDHVDDKETVESQENKELVDHKVYQDH